MKSLDISSILRSALVSSEWLAISRSEPIWKKIFEEKYGNFSSFAPQIRPNEHSFIKYWIQLEYENEMEGFMSKMKFELKRL